MYILYYHYNNIWILGYYDIRILRYYDNVYSF